MTVRKQATREGYFGASASARLRRLLRDERGAASTEYITLVGVVAIACTTAFIALGVAIAHDYQSARGYITYPVP